MRTERGRRGGRDRAKQGNEISARTSSSLLSTCLVFIPLVAALLLSRPGLRGSPNLSGYPWLYVSDGDHLIAIEDGLEVVAVGDVMLGRFVAYSLGNFVFDQGRGETRQALPEWARARPQSMSPEEARTLLESVAPPRRWSFACDEHGCRRFDVAQQAWNEVQSDLLWGGRIDLTGDGALEDVRGLGDQVVVYSDGIEVWRSPPTWRVVDVALGDPNDDGRDEMLLALWKVGLDGLETPTPEKERLPRSHLFIVGYRSGRYCTLWGGSAVQRPIQEVALGDVDGDLIQELVALDEVPSGERRLSVWRWHGWGFSLVWRSDSDPYRDLSLDENGIIHVSTD